MTAEEFSNRFDVLYNNIMSDQAPGLDDYEKSVFLNKAQLEVLKNHLNPKGNKYGEGFDGSSKRQIDFSDLTVSETYYLYPVRSDDGFSATGNKISTVVIYTTPENSKAARLDSAFVNTDKILSILNENVEVNQEPLVQDYKYQIDLQAFGLAAANDFNEDGKVDPHDLTALIDYIIKYKVFEDSSEDRTKAISTLMEVLLDGKPRQIVLSNPVPINTLYKKYCPAGRTLTVVPITSVEYDTLMSRPYKYPPRPQAWRLFVDGSMEIITQPDLIPTKYSIRYIKVPVKFDLTSNVISDIPEILHDEVLQRAVELAKNSWEGNSQTTVELGGRSE